KTWKLIVPGNFGGNNYTDLLFYDPNTGEGEFYTTDGSGNIAFLKKRTDWRKTWKLIVPGNFGGNDYTDLLFYDTTATSKWVGTRLDNQKPEVFTWVDPFWHEIIDGQTIKNNFKEISNDYSTVVIDQGVGPVFLTADGAYWKGKRFAVGTFEFSKHETWSGQRPANGGTVAYQFNKATGFWEEANNGVVTKNNFKEVENNKATVTIDQGFGPIYLTLDGAYYNGTKFASGNFGGK
ncbi:hypothetical protein H0901_24415, partial [Microcystis aeruginosa BLCCF158]